MIKKGYEKNIYYISFHFCFK